MQALEQNTNGKNSNMIENIDRLIQTRKPLAKKVKAKAEQLNLLRSAIQKLIEYCHEMKIKAPELAIKLEDIELEKLYRQIVEGQQGFNKLLKRFDRETINIGVAGIARQGKSTLLKTWSGVPDSLIPTSSLLPCTSSQIIIYHQTEKKNRVYFYSEEAFIKEVITPYYRELNFSHVPNSLAEFINSYLPNFNKDNYPDPARASSLYKHLQNYHDRAQGDNGYAKWIKPEAQIKQFLEQHLRKFTAQQYDDQGNPISFDHLAVRKVEIFYPFPKIAVEKIGLVDTPGLGDTRLGDRERMIKAIGEDVDFIVFVRKPDRHGGKWGEDDINLSDSAYQALKDKLPLEDWSFMILNHDNENLEICNILSKTDSKNSIRVAEFVIANCIDEAQANQILDRVLNYLAKGDRIVELDTKYLRSWQKSLEQLQAAVTTELTKASHAVKKFSNEHSQYVTLFDKLWEDLKVKLEELREELIDKPIKQDSQFKKQIDSAIEQCRKDEGGIPSLEDIITSLKETRSPGATYDRYLHQLRANTLKHFHNTEIGLKESLDEKKTRVAQVLQKLGLKNLSNNSQEIEFLRKLAEQIPTELTNLKRGFVFLADFDLQYKGFIQSIVWQHLRKYLPPKGSFEAYPSLADRNKEIQSSPSSAISYNESVAKLILANLKERYEQGIDRCEKALNILAYAPSEIGRSMIEEFIDHIIRAKDVEREWNKFLGDEEIRSLIWQEFKEIEQRQKMRQSWQVRINEAENIARSLANFG